MFFFKLNDKYCVAQNEYVDISFLFAYLIMSIMEVIKRFNQSINKAEDTFPSLLVSKVRQVAIFRCC